MADVTISALGTEAAPLDYTVPGAQEILVKAAFASFDGSSSASAYRPAVRLIAPGNVVVGEWTTDSDVAAGASADVSFFPGPKPTTAAPAPTATSLPLAQASDIDTVLVAGGAVTMNMNDWFGTTDTTVFSTRVVGGKTYLNCKKAGMYALRIGCNAQHPTVTGPLIITAFFDAGLSSVTQSEFDTGDLVRAPVTAGGANRWLASTDTYVAISSPGGAAFTAQLGTAGLSGNVNNQHTDIVMVRLGDFVDNVLF